MPRPLTEQLGIVLSGVESQLAKETDPRKRQALEAQRQTLLQAGALPATAATTAAAAPSVTSDVLRQVQAARPRELSVPQIIERPGQTVDLTPWLRAIGQTPAQPFNLQQLQQAVSSPLPEVPQARFAAPEQLGQWIAQFQQVQEPWLQAATQLAQAEANRQLQRLQSQWAARGLLASGAAAAQEREAVADLGQRLAELRTRALAESVNQALQAGQLSLDEAAQLWQMAYQGRQADVENLLRALGLQEEMRQNWLDQLARYWQAQIGQSQWAQELGLQRAAQEFQRWLGTQQLNQQAQADWLARLLQAGGLAEEARQFERQMPLREAELTGLLYGQPTLAARQFDWQRALQEAGLTGMWQGQPTWERLLQEAQLTGMYQGQPTWERLLQQAELTGYYQGRPTLERWWRSQQLSQAQAEAQQPSATERRTVALSRIAKELASMEKAGEEYEVAYGWLFTEAIPVLGEYGVSPSEALNLFASIYAPSPEEYDLRKRVQQARQKGRK